MITAETLDLNGAPPKRWLEMQLPSLKKEAALHGIRIDPGDRKEHILQKLESFRQEKHREKLQKECATKGLSTEGSIQDLEIRLEVASRSEDIISDSHRRGYTVAAIGINALGIVALIISLPHVASAINSLMACGMFFAYLLAIIIDVGIGGLKYVDTLKHKFEIGKLLPIVWSVMIICVVMSSALNAHEFLAHVADNVLAKSLATTMAVFVPLFAFSMFYVGSNMLVKCSEKKSDEGVELTPQESLAKIMEVQMSLQKWIEKIPLDKSGNIG